MFALVFLYSVCYDPHIKFLMRKFELVLNNFNGMVEAFINI